jgi:predicted alpha/beta-fold hydrolase
LLRWAEEEGEATGRRVQAIAAVSAPLDLAAGASAIHRGLSRQVYTRYFLRTMKPKALAMLERHPSLFDRGRLAGARSLRAFDDVFTAPLHGFRDAADYYARASAGPALSRIRIPALVLNARNDPFLPASALPRQADVGPHVTLWQPPHGGHVGFAAGRWPGRLRAMPASVLDWLATHATG